MTPNIADIIRHHVSLEVRCIDRLYVNGYMPKLQTSGGLCYFLHDHLGHPIPSPALFRPIHDRFVAAVEAFIARHKIPIVDFESGQDKDAHCCRVSRAIHGARGRRDPRRGSREDAIVQSAQTVRARQGRDVRLLAAARGGQSVLLLCPGPRLGSGVSEDRHVSALSGEAVSQWPRVGQAAAPRHRIRFESLDNGFLACAAPAALQADV